MMIRNFKQLTEKDFSLYLDPRKYEKKLGEVISYFTGGDFEKYIQGVAARYIIIGIPEQAGVLANYGKEGTQTLWGAFLRSFLNLQSNRFMDTGQISLGGYFDFSEELKLVTATAPDKEEQIGALHNLVSQIDGQVEDIVKIISRNGKVPVIIGGGHNNAYGSIKGAAKGLHAMDAIPIAQISAIGLDAHADYQKHEGRHSGNAFRYADEDGYLQKYFILGVHENYIPQYVMDDIGQNHFVDYITYEDIFIRLEVDFSQALTKAVEYVGSNFTGIEVDLSSIENILSSDETPCGVTTINARRFVHHLASSCEVAYLHICEGAAEPENESKEPLTGKLVSYLVSDFIKGHSKKLSAILQTSKS